MTLNFQFGIITDRGVKKLCSDGLNHLTSLTALNLNFEWCENITDEGVKSLCSDGFKHLTSLTALTLDFQHSYKITDKGVKSLCSDGLEHLTSLTALTLNFADCWLITNKGEEAITSWLDKVKHQNITSKEKPTEAVKSRVYNFKRGKEE